MTIHTNVMLVAQNVKGENLIRTYMYIDLDLAWKLQIRLCYGGTNHVDVVGFFL